MRRLVDAGEPVSSGRRDLRVVERKALADTLFAAGLFTLVVLVNGLLAILALGFMQAADLLSVSPEATEPTLADLSRELRAARSLHGM